MTDHKIVCTGCSLLCDDILVKKDNLFINEVIGACLKGKERFDQIIAENRILSPLMRKNDELNKIKWDNAFEKAIEMISEAKKPLYYGFSTTSCETQKLGIELAKLTNGFIDSNSIICQGKVLNLARHTNMSITSLTEVINKSDVIVLWGFNAAESIPRLLNKILFSRGKFRMTGREIKTLIYIDPVRTASSKVMGPRDLLLQIEPESDIELIRTLKDKCCKDTSIPSEGVAGIDKDDLKRLLAFLTDSEYITIFTGQGLLRSQENGNPIEELLELIEIINIKNKKGRIALIMAGGHYNIFGFDHTALALTGKNHSLQFQNKELIENKDTIITKIINDDFDFSMIVGTDPLSHLPFKIAKKLASRPLILIDNRKSSTYQIAELVMPTAITGIEAEGTAYRLDHVPLKLSKIIDPPNKLPSDEELFNQIINKIKQIQKGSD